MGDQDHKRDLKPHSASELIGRVAGFEEARSRHIEFLKHFPGIIYQSRLDWTPVLVVGAVEAITGLTSKELTSGAVPWPSLIHPDDLPGLMTEEAARLLESPGHSVTREYRVLRADGSVKWVREFARSPAGQDSRPSLIEGVIFDITELKHAQCALAESEARLGSIFRAAPVAIGTVAGRVFTQVNDRFCEMTGYSREEVLGRNARMIYPTQEEYDFVGSEKYDQISCTGIGTVETRWMRKDGVVIYVLLSSTPLKPDDPSAGVTFTAADLTEVKHSRLALDAGEDRYRNLVDSLIEGLAVIDPCENIVFANRAFARILGHDSPSEVTGRNISDYSAPEQIEAYSRQTENRARTANSNSYEAEIVRPGGEKRNVVISASPIIGKNGEFVGTQGLIVDITDRVRAERDKERLEAQVRHSQKLESLGVLAGGIAHDFNNILLTVLGNSELVLDEMQPGSKSRARVEAIRKAAMRAADLCRQMLAYSGRSRFELKLLDLSAQVEDIGHILDVSISKKSRVVYDLEIGLPAIEADPGQISQVILNLITNASEAMEGRQGNITVRTGAMTCDAAWLEQCWPMGPRNKGDFVFLEVEDQGVGIPPESLEKIFDPFFSTKFTGRGLGLSAVLGIVRGHGGAIRVRSEAGRGTCFKVLFPAVRDPAGSAQPGRKRKTDGQYAAEPVGGGKILLVDDDETIRLVGEAMLEMLGFETVSARDGAEAVEAFRKDPAGFAAVVMDLTMPEMDGAEACAEILKIRPGARVIIVSGYGDPDVERDLMMIGAVAYLRKPFQMKELRDCLSRTLGGPAAR